MTRFSLLLAAPFLFAQPALARHHRHHHVEKAPAAAEAPAPDAGGIGEAAKVDHDATGEKPPEAAAPPVPEPRPKTLEAAPASPADAAKAKKPDASTGPAAPEESQPKESGPPEIEKSDTRLYQTACPAVVSGAVKARLEPPIDDGICRAHSPYAVAAVIAGGEPVEVKGDVTMNCQMATALSRWLGQIEPAAAVIMKSRLVSVRIGTSFQCRRRYGAAEGPISEHAFADAVDLTGFTFADGTEVTVEKDWPEPGASGVRTQFLHLAHDTACGAFTTVLGPEANAAHRNHFHLDLSCHGKTCTYRICE